MRLRRLAPFALLVFVTGCKVGGCAANVLGDVVGETADVYCDRRFVTGDHEPASFCQEVIDTIAVSHVEDDCRDKHGARGGEGKCPRERAIAGCKIHKDNDDGSEVYDWYYDVADLEDAGRDGGADARPLFIDPPRTKADVEKLCADRARYEEGATFVEP